MRSPLSSRAVEFLSLQSRQDLAGWLNLTDRELRYILYALDGRAKYRSFTIAKRNGGSRLIEAPHPALKALQRKLLRVLEEVAPASGIAKGFVVGKSTIDHAWPHRRKRVVVLADLSEFFPSITFARIRGALLAKPFRLTPQVATCVAQLCCKDGRLPQGAPTSPVLSNLICRQLDHHLARLARTHRCTVTRYADDICFSTSQRAIPSEIAFESHTGWEAGADLQAAVTSSGFTLNPSKFKVLEVPAAQLVTGLIVNRGVSLPRRWRRQLRVMLHLVARHGESRAAAIAKQWKSPTASRGDFRSIEQVIRGKSHFAQHVDDRCGRTFSESLYRGYPSQRRLLPRPLGGIEFAIMAEGKTDLLHLEAAHRHFASIGLFSHLKPRFINFTGTTGDKELLSTLNRIAKSNVQELTIGVFDCDNPKLMASIGIAPNGYIPISGSVYAMCLAPSEHLGGSPFCIELLYARNELCKFSTDARRVFLPDEFDPAGISRDGVFQRQIPKKGGLIVEDQVVRIHDNYSSLLSKADFARLVNQSTAPFDQMNFDGFRATFELIDAIANRFMGR